ncbi:MAG: cyclase family protein [Candidatus Aminicenantes bacterium]|nr:cyclase family protein [Candidatus Aminicenantes bacterium]
MKNDFFTGLTATDLSHTISPAMPYFPGTEAPVFFKPFTLASHGFAEQRITMLTHSGTHMDAPAHLLEAGPTLEQLGLPHFVGAAAVLDVSCVAGHIITKDDLLRFRRLLNGKNFALLHTAWSKHWGHKRYFSNYPVLSQEAAQWLSSFGFKGVGVDTISFDVHDSSTLPIHHIFLNKNIVLIENMANLQNIPAAEFLFCCLPLKIAEADGAPVRAIALCDSRKKK